MRKLRLVLPILVVLLAIPAATAHAVARMPVGFFDDPSFRWSEDAKREPPAGAARAYLDRPRARVLVEHRAVEAEEPAQRQRPGVQPVRPRPLVIGAEQYGFEVLMTIAGTPRGRTAARRRTTRRRT